MDIYEKYNLDKENDLIVKELPANPKAYLYEISLEGIQIPNELYINNNGKLEHISTKPAQLSYVLLFLKKYRDDKNPLPVNVIDKQRSPEDMLKRMQFLIKKPINTFEEFKKRLLEATDEIPTEFINKYSYRFGDRLVFVSKREEFGNYINIYDEWIPVAKEYNEKFWERAVLFDKENKIFEMWYKEERTNDNEKRTNWRLDAKFYEEKYLYEYLLNDEICAVVS